MQEISKVQQSLINVLFFFGVFLSFSHVSAQVHSPAQNEPSPAISGVPKNAKVLDEHKDGKGNMVRTIQYLRGSRKVTETIITPIEDFNIKVLINPDTINKDSLQIVVTKSRYKLEIFYRRQLVRSYKAVFGPKPLANKTTEGDRCTPEGWFTIQAKNPNSHYNKFLLINYPNDSTYARLNRLKAIGKISKTAKPGNSIGIHGIWRGGDDMIEKRRGWTDGCIALKNKDIDELYSFVAIGTRVYIRK